MEEELMMTKEHRKVLMAVDESEESMYALTWCLRNLAFQTSNTTLLLLYVKPPPPVYSSLDAAGYLFGKDVISAIEDYNKELADSVMDRAEAIYRNSTTPMKLEKKIGSGDAKDVICETVERLGADILVMGCHGYGFFKRALLGSVSDHCSKHVKCPVLVVKRPKN